MIIIDLLCKHVVVWIANPVFEESLCMMMGDDDEDDDHDDGDANDDDV